MVAVFVLLTVLVCVGVEYLRGRAAKKHPSMRTKPEVFYHNPRFMPTPTMADGGKLVDLETKE
jgi:hypothetical protein